MRFFARIILLIMCLSVSVNISAKTLKIGMKGQEITALQNSLVAAGYLARTVDSEYGSTTEKAVSLFQKDKGLTITGEVDEKTLKAIKKAENKGYRNGGGIVYAKGNLGIEVEKWQKVLYESGYLNGDVDGIYGTETFNAVELFQKNNDIPVSGAIDEMTLSALEKRKEKIDLARKNNNIYLYTSGDVGKDIENIQTKLQEYGYLDGDIDGIYGSDIENAIKKLQEKSGLAISGSIDEETMRELLNTKNVYDKSLHKKYIMIGDSGIDVGELQNKLILHGYNPGIADGFFGNDTETAVKLFQKDNNLEVTGIADSVVIKNLKKAPYFKGEYKKKIHMQSTAYTPLDGDGNGKTSMGAYAGKGHAAVDPSVIPLGSTVFIEGYGYAVCDDIGGSIKGNIIDVGVDTLNQAYQWGYKEDVLVYVI